MQRHSCGGGGVTETGVKDFNGGGVKEKTDGVRMRRMKMGHINYCKNCTS